jgi:hypothetical protein
MRTNGFPTPTFDLLTGRNTRTRLRLKPGDEVRDQPGDGDFRPDRKLIARILANNYGDYMSLGLFSCLVHGPAPTTGNEDRLALLYLKHLLAEGYVTIGDVYGQEYFPWNCGVAEALSWVSPKGADGLHESWPTARVAWLNNTPRGNDLARSAMGRRRR